MAEKFNYPWFPFYGFDFYNSAEVQAMDNAEQGVYVRLLWLCWCNGGIPDNMDILRGVCRFDSPAMAKSWPRLSRCFIHNPEIEGMLYNIRQHEEREKVIADHAGRSADGARGAAKRWGKNSPANPLANSPPIAPPNSPAYATSTSTSTSTSTKREKENKEQKEGEAASPPAPAALPSPHREDINGIMGSGLIPPPASISAIPSRRFTPPTEDELVAYALSINFGAIGDGLELSRFRDHFEANGWMAGRVPMKDWRAAMRKWKANAPKFALPAVASRGRR